MKVIEIGTGYTPIPAKMGAATEIVVEELVKSMMKKNVDVTLVDIKADERLENNLPIEEVWVPGCFNKSDVSLGIVHKLKRVVYSISLAFKLKKIVKKEPNKVVLHFHNQYNMFFYNLLTPNRLKEKAVTAYTVHSYIWHDEWEKIQGTIKKKYFQEVSCVQNADKVFVLNRNTLKNMVDHANVSSEKIHLIDNGVNTEIYHPLNEMEKEVVKKIHGLSGKKVFIQVGSVCDRKNQLGSIELLLPLMKQDKDIVFCYAGGIISEEYYKEINEFTIKNDVQEQVRYFGELKPGAGLNEFYNLAEAMVFPSKAEGFSLVVIESMSAGVPVIINDELEFKLKDDCIRYSTKESFSNMLERIILDKKVKESVSKEVREAVLKQYSWDFVADKYIELFR